MDPSLENLDLGDVERYQARALGDCLVPTESPGEELVAYRRERYGDLYQDFGTELADLAEQYSRLRKDAFRRVNLGHIQLPGRLGSEWRLGPFGEATQPRLQTVYTRFVGELVLVRRDVCYAYSFTDGVAWCEKFASRWHDPQKQLGRRPLREEETRYLLGVIRAKRFQAVAL